MCKIRTRKYQKGLLFGENESVFVTRGNPKNLIKSNAWVAELVDARDLKSLGP
jgi:hypothetical protein